MNKFTPILQALYAECNTEDKKIAFYGGLVALLSVTIGMENMNDRRIRNVIGALNEEIVIDINEGIAEVTKWVDIRNGWFPRIEPGLALSIILPDMYHADTLKYLSALDSNKDIVQKVFRMVSTYSDIKAG